MSQPNIAQRIEHRVKDEVHDCIAPGCGQRATTAFLANEAGRLAGRLFQKDEFVDLCAPHADDVYRAQGVTDASQLSEWLRADARRDPLDLLFED